VSVLQQRNMCRGRPYARLWMEVYIRLAQFSLTAAEAAYPLRQSKRQDCPAETLIVASQKLEAEILSRVVAIFCFDLWTVCINLLLHTSCVYIHSALCNLLAPVLTPKNNSRSNISSVHNHGNQIVGPCHSQRHVYWRSAAT